MDRAKILIEIALFWLAVAGVIVFLWRFIQSYQLTVLICPHCQERTPHSRSKSNIICRRCGADLKQQGRIVNDVQTVSFRVFERSRNAD